MKVNTGRRNTNEVLFEEQRRDFAMTSKNYWTVDFAPLYPVHQPNVS